MARQNVPFLAFNRGLVSPKALARVDLDRTRLSAEVMTNWLPKSQGGMRIRPGTKHLGSSINDTGAEWIEFVAATDDTALIELTHQQMRVWIDDALMQRPSIATALSISDTGWDDSSTGGNLTQSQFSNQLPVMTGNTTNGVTVSVGPDGLNGPAYFAADGVNTTHCFLQSADTGTWWWKADFGSGNTKKIKSVSVRAASVADYLTWAPKSFRLESNDVDTGDGWTNEIFVSSQTGWAVSEKRTFEDTGYSDTGASNRRYWRLRILTADGGPSVAFTEVEMFPAAGTSQATFGAQGVRLNASAIGSVAKATKRVVVDTGDANVEHSLAIAVTTGPVVFRCGSTAGDDDYVSETTLGTGYHNLAFTPADDFHITIQSDALVDRLVASVDIGDTGTVVIPTFIDAADLSNVRYDQSADVVYIACDTVNPHKIERRGTGRSWSFVKFEPDNGPFLSSPSSAAKLSVSHQYGNTTLSSDTPFFRSGHVGALVRLFHEGQSGLWPLGALHAVTDAVMVTGISDTGTASTNNERRLSVSVTGTWAGTLRVERSFDGPDVGFHPATPDFMASLAATDTGTFTRTIDDRDDNTEVWYRLKVTAYTSGVALVTMTYKGGGVNGVARITEFNSNTSCDIEVLSRFSDTGPTETWQEGAWSEVRRFPSAVTFHGGRLFHAAGANLYGSVADDYENHDEETEGDAAPISRTLGSGPVDNVHYLISLLRLIIGTSGAEIAVRSSSLDEPLTPSNSSARTFSTQGSANLRALKMDTKGIIVQRSSQRVFMIGFGENGDALGDYDTHELTMLVPDLLAAGVVSMAIQRQPDTRVHCVLANGKVAILTYEPQEDVVCWSMWETDGLVERAAVLPGTGEDKVYYHVNRTIGGLTKRFLEVWATEEESIGDTGLSWIADCARSYTDTGRNATLTDICTHLPSEAVVVWSDDTGTIPGVDRSPDVAGVQTTYTVDTGGDVTLTTAVHHAVAGLPYTADWKSTKLAYAAEAGTALAQMKRTDKMGFVLYQTHNNGLFFGNDTGNLDPLPRVSDGGGSVDADKIFETFDQVAMPFPGLWSEDARIHLRAKAPRPAMVLAAIPTVTTSEKV